MDKLLQFKAVEAERKVLGAVLVDNKALDEILEVLKPEDFWLELHRIIFESMGDLFRHGTGVDLITLDVELKKDKRYGTQATDLVMEIMTEVVTTSFLNDHIKLIKDKSLRRALCKAGMDIHEQAYADKMNEEELLGFAESQVFEISKGVHEQGLKHVGVGLDEAYKFISAKSRGEISGLQTGLKDFDTFTGGLQSPDLIILAGRPKMGKTALAFTIATHVAKTVPVAAFSLEMSRKQLCVRMMGAEAGVNTALLNSGRFSDPKKLLEPMQELNLRNLYIDDSPTKTPIQVLSQCKRMKASKGLGLIVIDYLQLMTADGNHNSREQEISSISRFLKRIAKELEVPVLALAQLSRKVEGRDDKRPVSSDLRESGAIEQDADMITFIYREEVYNKDAEEGKSEWIISDYRNGAPGTVDLFFNRTTTTFTGYSRREEM